jgi:SAM-dependent methyltransferase
MTFRPCPLCGERCAEILHHQPFVLPAGHPLQDGYDVVGCCTCGVVYADTGVQQDTYDRYYAELSKYEDPLTATGGGEQPWDEARLSETSRALTRYLQNPGAKVVDLGCANGGLLRCLSALGFHRLYGVDPSPACAAAAGRVAGAAGMVGSLFELPAGLDDADCVILSHVLEHLHDVGTGLGNALSLLRPGGILYVEVPDATRYAACVTAPFQDFNTEHLNHFGPASLRVLLEQAGLEVLAIEQKTIEAAPGIPYPAVSGIGRRRSDHPLKPPSIRRDEELRSAIAAYIRRSLDLLVRLDGSLARLVEQGEPLLVWGVGQLTLKLLAMTRLSKAPIRAFIDSNPRYHGMMLLGVPVLSPAAAREYVSPILIGTLLHTDAIVAQIEALGLTNKILRLDALLPPAVPQPESRGL